LKKVSNWGSARRFAPGKPLLRLRGRAIAEVLFRYCLGAGAEQPNSGSPFPLFAGESRAAPEEAGNSGTSVPLLPACMRGRDE